MTDDADLIKRTKSALENVGDCPWLPGLTGDLAKMGWQALYQKTGLSSSNYGTSRVIARNVHAPRNLAGYLSTSLAVEILDGSHASNYEDAGIEFYTQTEIIGANLLSCVEDAMNLIKQVPTLHTTVAALVKSLHLIKPADDDYDVSFSEPHIPFSVFVSIPQHQSSTTALRVAEAVVHEAMHLQLTLIERILLLVRSTEEKYFSPWRREFRDARGVLHAFYVFRVIDCFLGELLNKKLIPSECCEYLQDRKNTIEAQAGENIGFLDCPDLTSLGRNFIKQLVSMYA